MLTILELVTRHDTQETRREDDSKCDSIRLEIIEMHWGAIQTNPLACIEQKTEKNKILKAFLIS